MNLSLRPYQQEAVQAVASEFKSGKRSTLVVHPTGCGKTVVFSAIAAASPRPVLVLAHRGQLVDQAAERIARDTGCTVAVEMAERSAAAAMNGLLPPHVVVASVQSMVTRLDRYDPDTFGLVIIDEAHHCTPGSQYATVADHFPDAKVLGVTATPDRLDGKGMGEFFESAAHVYDIFEAIRDGWLVPVTQRRVAVDSVDLRDCKVSRVTKDYDEDDLASRMIQPEALHEVCAPLAELAKGRQTVVFSVTVLHAQALEVVLSKYTGPGSVKAVSGQTDRSELYDLIERFRRREFQTLINCALLTEGFDAPEVSCVAMARPTRSRSLYAQCMGRGTRLAPHIGKTDLLALDFVPRGAKVGLIGPANVLDGSVDERTSDVIDRLTRENPGKSVSDAIVEAREILADLDRQQLLARASYRVLDVSEISPFDLLHVVAAKGRWGGVPATDGQIGALERIGVKDASQMDKGQAHALLDAVSMRKDKGLCTYKQALFLARNGLNPDVSFEDASFAIDTIAKARWRVPTSLRLDPRFAPRSRP